MDGHTATWLLDVSLGLLFASPWLAASVWFWRGRIRDGAIPASIGEQMRRRWLS
jgi:hypothetical protein